MPLALACVKGDDRAGALEAIQKAVAEQFGLRLVEIKAKNNSRSIVYPRQIAMYLAKHLTEASLPEIGRQFGNKHHTTVMHSIGKIDELRRTGHPIDHPVTFPEGAYLKSVFAHVP